MKVWLPFIGGGSGTDIFTKILARGLLNKGVDAIVTDFAHKWQYAPWALARNPAPKGTDIVLANSWNAFAFRRPKTKLVAVEHLFVLDPALAPYKSVAQSIFHRLFVRHFEEATQRKADRLVAVSRYTARAYVEGLGGTSPEVIVNGIDTDFFSPSPAAKHASADRPFRLLFVGNMSRRKGADMIPGIMKSLGDGYELAYTAGLRANNPFPELKNARRLGRLDHEAVREEYRRADILLFPTRLEGLPLVAMEAMACGTPVVASNTASLPEVVTHGETGMLCTLDDSRDFAQAIEKLRRDSENLRRMSDKARQTAQTRFSLPRMADDYLTLFTKLLH